MSPNAVQLNVAQCGSHVVLFDVLLVCVPPACLRAFRYRWKDKLAKHVKQRRQEEKRLAEQQAQRSARKTGVLLDYAHSNSAIVADSQWLELAFTTEPKVGRSLSVRS